MGQRRQAKFKAKKGSSGSDPGANNEIEYEMRTKAGRTDQESQNSLRISQRQKKPINIKDYGFVEKESRPRGRPSHQSI
eukprot:CAMPEP_0202959538 /NCGR_PEP_ID=MMETSP1396-20130829/3708_1 /ASSEMBLY_ACC=CAM_ASM_000872 /TAXON_ID= /ORGANISM="Pseudokeronopsis sp., Strain Brazil" /LENGTH=78 /DNA_ID=CAMNT_0049678133 /DNA_START=378 /DNA_END=614 /DNA_ORIENTATION=+